MSHTVKILRILTIIEDKNECQLICHDSGYLADQCNTKVVTAE